MRCADYSNLLQFILDFWLFVTYDENDLIDSYRVEYGDSPIYDGEVEVAFEDLFQQPEGDWRETYRAGRKRRARPEERR